MTAATVPASIAAMYQDALLAHHRAPKNRRQLSQSTGSAKRKNPVCGDEIAVDVRIEHEIIAEAAFNGRGCSIATASASLMTEAVTGLTAPQADHLIGEVERMISGEPESALPASLTALRGVIPFRGRHGCVLMPWLALRDALTSSLSSNAGRSTVPA